MSTASRWNRLRGLHLRQTAGMRFGIQVSPNKVLYYDIDPDGTVYWLLPRRQGKLERRKVQDPNFANFIRSQGEQVAAKAKGERDGLD